MPKINLDDKHHKSNSSNESLDDMSQTSFVKFTHFDEFCFSGLQLQINSKTQAIFKKKKF